MKNVRYSSIPLVVLLALFSAAWLDPYRDAVSSGNREFHEKKYHGARRYYQKAERHAPGQDEKKKLSFNTGDAEYMLEDYESAVTDFRRAVQSEDRDVQKKAFFNIGNAHMKRGDYREAVDAYISALKLDPEYLPAKKNLEYLLRRNEKKDEGKQGDTQKDGAGKNENKNKNEKQNDKKKKDDGNREGRGNEGKREREGRQGENRMNPEQIRNILRSLEKSPVRRQKGDTEERRSLEKNW